MPCCVTLTHAVGEEKIVRRMRGREGGEERGVWEEKEGRKEEYGRKRRGGKRRRGGEWLT